MDLLRVFTLGGLRFLRGDEPIPRFETRKAEALLVYLVCNRRTHSRDILADLLWDERSQEQAMANLRVLLTSLRKHLGPYLVITRESVSLNPEAQIWTDVAELEERSSAISGTGGIASEADAQQIQGAIDLYVGDFLEGFYVHESRGFDDWMVRERERLHRLVVDALHGLVGYYLQSGDYYWNSGMFVWRADVILEEFTRYLPETKRLVGEIGAAFGTPAPVANSSSGSTSPNQYGSYGIRGVASSSNVPCPRFSLVMVAADAQDCFPSPWKIVTCATSKSAARW